MTVGILGLGLIGGSLARAYAKTGHRVLAADKDTSILDFAMLADVVHGQLNSDNVGECDLILLAIFSGGSAKWLEDNAMHIQKNALVICTISNHLITGEETTAEERQSSFGKMITLALESAIKSD